MSRVQEKSTNYPTARPIAPGFGERISAIADLIGSRKEAALVSGVAVGSIQRYIAGENIPGFDVCARLCAAASVRMEWLAFATGPMSPPESFVIPPRESQPARQVSADIQTGLRHSAVKITTQVLGEAGLLSHLTPDQFADLAQIVFNDLARGAADDAAVASLGRILAINRKP